ncbi:MAG: DNA polymerase/3'-5' exonuclease PolX [Candidatus Omnitrophica bacterium]|nr:DNA polymerase/3'-5' exonuclease PolX [Candidatus Omnitrophota bacterium]
MSRKKIPGLPKGNGAGNFSFNPYGSIALMKNQQLADLLMRFGQLLEISDENPFKVRAYYKAAENISSLGEDVELIWKGDRLAEIPGIGKALEEKIIEYLQTGRVQAYERLTQEIPESVLDVMEVPSVGPKKAKLFFKELGVKSVDDLKQAAEQGRLLTLSGLKQKTVDNILSGIAILTEGQKRMNIATAMEIAGAFIGQLKKLKEVRRIDAAGSLRRCKETIGDIDLLVDASDPQKVMDVFVSLPEVKKIQAHGETKSSVRTYENVQVDLRVIPGHVYGAALLHLTGSQAFNVRLRQLAIKKEMKVSEYGIFQIQGDKEKLLPSETEEKCFEALGLCFVPPELREEIGEEELWSGEKLPKLVGLSDLKGDLHTHSTYSDGRHSVEQMAQAAQALGYEYLALSDHSAKLKVARGVSQEDLLRKIKEIEMINKKLKGFRVLCGSEVEIDSDGNLDYNDNVLSQLDFVIASVHSGFEQSKDQLTRRLVAACRNKYVHAIGHPFGRHIGKRNAYEIDFNELCKVAADTGTWLEINSCPIRLDLDSANAYFARRMGVRFLINTDAHSVEQLSFMKFGIGVGRRAWLTKKDIINTLSLQDLYKELGK